jgi:arylsulfatase A-like enzyme
MDPDEREGRLREQPPLLDRREFVRLAGLAGASLAFPARSTRDSTARPPNFVFILIDDLGWRDTGFMGSSYYETPNIDRLAREGAWFTAAYASAPNCAPSRACLLTGQYTPRHGVYTVGNPARGQARNRKLVPTPNRTELDPGAVTIAEALRPAGYVSASIGKWHLGDDPEFGPVSQGFDLNFGGGRAGNPGTYFSPYRNVRLPADSTAPAGEYLTDRLTDEAIGFIERNSDRPFFLYLPHYAVHTPIQAKEETIRKYREKVAVEGHDNPAYAAMIESTDDGVGRILNKLDELGLAGNTVVFFFSDNGGFGPATSMAPLRGSKGMLYEGGIREPMIVRWPGRIVPGTRIDIPVNGIDFYPTMLAMAGINLPAGHAVDGVSLVPLLRTGDGLDRDKMYWHFPAYLEADRSVEGPWRTTPAGAIRKGDWKLIEFFEDGRLELYNLADDIGEEHDLAGEMPEKAEELHADLVAWRRAVNAPVPDEPNPRYRPGP